MGYSRRNRRYGPLFSSSAVVDQLLTALTAASHFGYVPAVGKLWKEIDGSRVTPAIVDGDVVGDIAEYTGLGPSARAPTDAARGILRIRGGLRWIEVTRGTTEYLFTANTILVDGQSLMSYFAAHQPTDYVPTRQFVIARNNNAASWGGYGLATGQLYGELPAGAPLNFNEQHTAGLNVLDEINNGGGAYSGKVSGVTQTPASGILRTAGTGACPTRLFRRDYPSNFDYYGGRFFGLAIGPYASGTPANDVRTQTGLLSGLRMNYLSFATTDLPTLYAAWNPTTDAFQNSAGTTPVTADNQPCLSLKTGSILLVATGTGPTRVPDGGVPSLKALQTGSGNIWTATGVNFNRQDWSVHLALTLQVVSRGIAPAGHALFGAGSGNYAQVTAAGMVSITTGGVTTTGSVRLPPGRFVFGLISTASGIQVRANGALLETIPLALAAGTLADLQLFSSSDLSNPMQSGTINQIVLCSPAPSAADTTKVEEYLRRNYPPTTLDYMKVGVVAHGNSLVSAGSFLPPILTALGSGYAGINRGLAGQTIDMMLVSGPADADPYYDATRYLGTKYLGWEITNQIRVTTDNSATVLSKYRANRTAREAVFGAAKVVLLDCLPATDLTVGNGKEAIRVAVNVALAAEYTIATSDPLVWGKVGGGYLVQVSGIPELSDPTNATYYTDGLHLTTAAYALIAARVAVALAL